MPFSQTTSLPDGWTFKQARRRLEEFQRQIEESEDLEQCLLFEDDDEETAQIFTRREDQKMRGRVILLRFRHDGVTPEICFLADTEFDHHEVFAQIFGPSIHAAEYAQT